MSIYELISLLIQKIKEKKNWKKFGKTTGTMQYNVARYTELILEVRFGGVVVSQIVPTGTLTTSGITLMVGWYQQSAIYVNASTSSARITAQPQGYTAELHIYAR